MAVRHFSGAFAPHPTNPLFIDRTGHVYDKRTVLGYAGRDGHTWWWCACACGRISRVSSSHLSQGCRECTVVKHGHARNGKRHPLYRVWSHMIERCENPNNEGFKDYGARGIKVCPRWRESFTAFLTDMGERPTPKHTIDRKDNDKGYEPGNARWATAFEQANNKRSSRWVTHDGHTLTLKQAATLCGITYSSLHSRLLRGWPVEKALTQSVRPKRKH